jgi:hypothetical protein
MSNTKKEQITKLLQESLKLDRCGIRWGWSNELNRDTFIYKMEFSFSELMEFSNYVKSERMNEFVELARKCENEIQ